MGVDYARHTTASPPGFKMLSTPLYLEALHAKKQFLVHIYQYFDGSFSNKKCVQLF